MSFLSGSSEEFAFAVKLNSLADLELHIYISAFLMSKYVLSLFTSFELEFV